MTTSTAVRTFTTSTEAFASAKLLATRGQRDWLVWRDGSNWSIARRTLESLEAVAAQPNLTVVDRRGWLHKLSPTRVSLEIKNLRAGYC